MDHNQLGAANVQANDNKVEADALGLGKTFGKLNDTLAGLLNNLLEPASKAAGGAMGEYVEAWRKGNLLNILRGYKAKCEALGYDPTSLPPALLLPGMEAAKDVDDPDLQELWQQLLANAAGDQACRQVLHLETLKRLTATDAKMLDRFLSPGPLIPPGMSPDEYGQSLQRLEALGLIAPSYQAVQKPQPSPTGKIVEWFDIHGNRVRMVEPKLPSSHGYASSKPNTMLAVQRTHASITPYGRQFLAAVKPKPQQEPGNARA